MTPTIRLRARFPAASLAVGLLVGGVILPVTAPLRGPAMAQAPRSPGAAPARDGNIAIQEELDAARRAGTRDAYDLFLARHPDHPLARTARQEREALPQPRR